ncbi:MAG: cyanophycinase [Sumerlaeia bacterium]
MSSFPQRSLMLVSVLACSAALPLTACAQDGSTAPAAGTPASPKAGHLIIVGGGLWPENTAVYEKILSLVPEDGRIGILPTASGEPESSGPAYVDDFTTYGAGSRTELIEITFTTPERASENEYVSKIADKQVLFFTGGDQSRITAAFRTNGQDTPGYRAVKAVLDKGGVIAGSSAGAAMMSDPMLRWGDSEEALLIGQSEAPDRGVGIGQGMGFFPYGLTGQHFLQRGRFGRLIAALEATDKELGFGVEYKKGIHVDLAQDRIQPLHDQALLLIDRASAAREGLARKGLRVSLLGPNEIVNANTGDITIVPAEGRETLAALENGMATIAPMDGAFDDYKLQEFIVMLAKYPADKITVTSDFFEFHLREDDRTQFLTSGTDESISALNILLDIVPKEGAEAEAKRLTTETATEAAAGEAG